MPWMCGQLQVLRLDFKIGELVRHLAVNVTMPDHGLVISELTLEEKWKFTTEFTENTETSFI